MLLLVRVRPYRDDHWEALEFRFGLEPQTGRMSELGHEPTFAACQRSVWNTTVSRHSAPNVGKPRANTKEKQALLVTRSRVMRQSSAASFWGKLDVSVRLCRPDRSAVQRHTCSGPPDHLKARLRLLPCPGRPLSAIWNCVCGGRHARIYLARIAKGLWSWPKPVTQVVLGKILVKFYCRYGK